MPTTYAPMGKATFRTEGTYTYYELLSDGDDIVSSPGILQTAAGIQKRGAILKWDPATGNVTAPAVETDCNCILVDDADPTTTPAACSVYRSGKFKADAVIWPGVLSHALITDALRHVTILLESVVFTDGSLVKTDPTEAEAANAKKVIEENKAKEKEGKKAAEEAEPEVPPRDSPYAYLTEEEKQTDPALATIHDMENEEKKKKEGAEPGKQPAPNPSHNPPHPPQTPPKNPPRRGEGD